MRIKPTPSKTTISYSIIKDFTRNGVRSTKAIHKIGNNIEIDKFAKEEGITREIWLKKYLSKYIEKHTVEEEIITIKKSVSKQIKKNDKNAFNIGYLFLESIYYDLKLNEIAKEIEEKNQFKFDLNDVFSRLIYSRIIYPSSKYKTHRLSKNFIEAPTIKLENIYRGLTYLNKQMDYIQEKLFENSLKVVDRNAKIIYFDCTNFFFSIHEEDDFRKYGYSKQHQPNPLVGMGLFMDADGIPLAFNIYPGSANETTQMLPTENKIINKFKLKDTKTVICTDAMMCTDDIKKYNIKDGRGFVITQSLKKMKEDYRKEILDPNGWRLSSDFKNTYNIDTVQNDEHLSEKYYDTLFYKIISTETASVKQDTIATFSLKYKDYNQKIRNNQIQRAKEKIENNNSKKIVVTNNQNDFKRFIKETAFTKENEEAEIYIYDIDENIIREEEKYDGFYCLTTNLIDDIETILKVAKGRWEIEESFRIMKSDFLARPVNLSREDRIQAHFMTCFIALLIHRILEKKLDYKYTSNEILECLRNMNVFESKGDGYIPTYERTDLTDDLHDIFNFRTDVEIISYKYLKNIFDKIKKKS